MNGSTAFQRTIRAVDMILFIRASIANHMNCIAGFTFLEVMLGHK
jgi:hypothetical protein